MFKVIHLSLPNSEFKASLDYKSPCLKKQIVEETNKDILIQSR